MWRARLCIYVQKKEGKNKVSMETKELCLIGNNTSKRSEIKGHKAGLTQSFGNEWQRTINTACFDLLLMLYLFTQIDSSICAEQAQHGFGHCSSSFCLFLGWTLIRNQRRRDYFGTQVLCLFSTPTPHPPFTHTHMQTRMWKCVNGQNQISTWLPKENPSESYNSALPS